MIHNRKDYGLQIVLLILYGKLFVETNYHLHTAIIRLRSFHQSVKKNYSRDFKVLKKIAGSNYGPQLRNIISNTITQR